MKKYCQYITLILGIAFILRIAGINFGLPLWVVGDEPGLIFGTLKMLELKTVIPSLHVLEFSKTFYYAAYLPIFYIVPFTLAAGTKFLFFTGTFLQFKNFLSADPSLFFLVARLISVLFGTATVWFTYQIGKVLFKNERAGLFSAIFFGTSSLLVMFSHWARHWTPVTFFFTLIVYVLSRPHWSVARRYSWALLISGLSVGVSLQAGLSLFFVPCWFLLVDRLSIIDTVKKKWFIFSGLGLLILIAIAYLLWPNSFGFLYSIAPGSSAVHKNFSGLISSYVLHVINLLVGEPIFFIFSLVGLWQCARRYRGYFWSFLIFIIVYIAIFYFTVGTNSRYIQMIYPLLALVAGFGLAIAYEKIISDSKIIASSFLGLMIAGLVIPTIRLDYLLTKNDTRIQAIEWVEHLPTNTKISVVVPMMRLPATADAINSLEQLDPSALRTVDKAERILDNAAFAGRHFNALNLYTVSSPDVFHNLRAYLKKNNYEYLIINQEYARERGVDFQPEELGKVVQTFKGSISGIGYGIGMINQGIPDGYGDGLRELFLSPNFGPDIAIIKLY